ncbi:MAG TPA: hypothetical protein VFI30_05130 [Nocardioidaceae bacterium]|nr:hypothetical protein [Nocardioidaceae bacterium]
MIFRGLRKGTIVGTGIAAAFLILAQGQGAFALPGAPQAGILGPARTTSNASTSAVAGAFKSLNPKTVFNTTSGLNITKGAIAAGRGKVATVAGHAGVPATGAGAVAVEVTVSHPRAGGRLAIYATGNKSHPTVLRFRSQQTVTGLVVTRLSPAGEITVRNLSGGALQAWGVVLGYTVAGTPNNSGTLGFVTPATVFSTVSGLNASKGAIAAGSGRVASINGHAGIPSTGVGMALVEVTVSNPAAAGRVAVYPAFTKSHPTMLRFRAHQTVTQLVWAKLSSKGQITVRNYSGGSIQVWGVAIGYARSGTPSLAGATGSLIGREVFNTVSGLDTAKGSIAAGQGRLATLAGHAGVPATGTASVALEVTVSNPPAGGHIAVYSAYSKSHPTVLRFGAHQTATQLVVTRVNSHGQITIRNFSSAAVQVWGVALGYVRSTSASTAFAWGSPTTLEPTQGPAAAVSCATATLCVAVDGRGKFMKYNGTAWAAPKSIDIGGGGLTSVSCPTTSFCAAVDARGNALTFDGNKLWAGPTNIDGTGTLTSVSCSSATFCVAVDDGGRALTFNGSTWGSATTIGSGNALTGVSCLSSAFCVAVDDAGNGLAYDGSNWTSSTIGTSTASSVSCVSTTFCVAVNGSDTFFKYDGSSWSNLGGPSASFALAAVSCTSTTNCVAVDDSGNAITYEGTSSFGGSPIDGSLPLLSVSCPQTGSCMAVDAAGNVLQMSSGTWSAPSVLDVPTGHPASVSCYSATMCANVDDAGAAVTFNGHTWSAPTNVVVGSLVAVSCPSATFCLAIDGSKAYKYNGSSWSAGTAVGSGLTGVSCTSSTLCVAVDGSGNAYKYNGSSWSGATVVTTGAVALNAVSCASTTVCLAVDSSGNGYHYNGSTWTSGYNDGTAKKLTAVSCRSATFCIAVDTGGRAFRFNGTGWGTPTTLESGAHLRAVSCSSTTFCAVIDGSGNAFTYNGKTWSSKVNIDSTRSTQSVSCTGATSPFCMVVDRQGKSVTGSVA